MKRSTGALRFSITDSTGTVKTAETSTAYTFAAGTWKHVAVSWNLRPGTNQTLLQIMIDGVLVNTLTATPFRTTTSGAIATFGTIYIGDNRTSGVTPTGGSPNGANGTIDEVYIYSTEINATQAAADFALTRSTCTTFDHFHIVHNGEQVNCSGAVASVTVEAHDVNHALFSLSGTTMAMSTSTGNGTWSSVSTINPVTSGGGGTGSYIFANESSIILGLADPTFETLNINLNSGGITELSGAGASCVVQDYTFGTTCDANLTFTQSGFMFSASAGGGTATIPTQTAGTASGTFYLRAVKATTATAACQAALVGANTVNFGYECNNPTTCSSSNLMSINGGAATTIAKNNNGAVASYTSVPMTFDASGNAPFTFTFSDVGQTRIWVNKTINSASVTGSSNQFVTKPFGFTVSGIQTTAGAVVNPAAPNASGGIFIKAGNDFTATVTATAQGGAATPNYGKETPAETVKLTAALVGGLGLTNLVGLTNPTAFGAFTNGVATGTTFSWGEVGIITLTPSIGDADYLGAGDVMGTTTGNVGRFIPDHFAVTAGAVTAGCSGAFTYFGQDGFTTAFTLNAQNLANTTTQNYAGSFAKLGLTSWASYGFTGPALPVGSTLQASGTAPTGSWTLGSASVSAKHIAGRPTAAAAETTVIVNAAPTDSDAVTMTAAAVAGGTPVRFGRLRVPNGAGSQYRNLKIPVVTQYWNGTAFATNTLDSCTSIPSTAFSFGNFRKTLTSADAVVVGAPVTFASGLGTMTLQKPGGTRTGTYDLSISLTNPADNSCLKQAPAWTPSVAASASANLAYLTGAWCAGSTYDKDPSSRISFGLYRGADKMIYLRENF
jgi:MSHA biogenesis protein MshQ